MGEGEPFFRLRTKEVAAHHMLLPFLCGWFTIYTMDHEVGPLKITFFHGPVP